MSFVRGAVWTLAVLVVLYLCIGLAPTIISVNQHYHRHVATCTVTEKDRGGNEGGMRVYTEQCGVLSNHDAMFVGKFRSSEVQGQLKPGHTYQLDISGARLPLFSEMPNINKVVAEATK